MLTSAPAPAQVVGSIKALFYGPTSGGLAASTPNIVATVWDEPTWASKTTADFAAFDVIIFGDQTSCFGDPAVWNTAVTNRQVWSSAVSGNVTVNGTDPDYHGKTTFVHQSVQFAAGDDKPGPGLYVSLSCAYDTFVAGPQTVALLGGIGNFIVHGDGNCPGDAHKVADHPSLAGLDDAYLSWWGCSSHNIFVEWPGSFVPLVIIQDAEPPAPAPPLFNAPDGSQGYAYVLARGAVSECAPLEFDADRDCLMEETELYLGTNPNDADTDDDGLLDSWEVGDDVPGSGIRLASGEVISRDDVFGPFANATNANCSQKTDAENRLPRPFRCYNHRPNPLHKNLYVEMDWQDCSLEGSCPEAVGIDLDPLHHAPSPKGILDVIEMLGDAPVTNPDGETGIVLSVLIDEAIPHAPNCDQNSAFARSGRFGTVEQRKYPPRLAAKELAVRYAWSGHSSASDHNTTSDPCPLPDFLDFISQGLGHAVLPGANPDLAAYDFSPFGDANVGGRDILVSMGPLWGCSSKIGLTQPLTSGGFSGPCFRETRVGQDAGVLGQFLDPGIFPTKVPVPYRADSIEWNHPINRLLGQREADGIRQLWARSFARLLGRSLGLDTEIHVQNKPAPAGRKQADHDNPLTPLKPDFYGRWDGLVYAPTGVGTAMQEDTPNYDELSRTNLALSDPDDDGVMEHDDNCPGVWNPDQRDMNLGFWAQLSGVNVNTAEFGDACDPDIDGDGKRNPLPGDDEEFSSFSAFSSSSSSFSTLSSDEDPFPYDTNDDGQDNDIDTDDDGDGVLDATDNCDFVANAGQGNRDGDGLGNHCDPDKDGDGYYNVVERKAGSLENDATRKPEYVGAGTCSDGIDNDVDTKVDAADTGCVDGDGDGVANVGDNCPATANPVQSDDDGNGVGDVCELGVRIESVSYDVIGADQGSTELAWSATRAGSFSVRLAATDCATGTVLDSGTYDPGTGPVPEPAFLTIDADALAEGTNTVTVCVTAASVQKSTSTEIFKDVGPPDTTITDGPPAGGSSGPDVTFTLGATEIGGFECSLDGGAFEECAATQTYTGLDPGAHTFSARAVDGAGNRDPSPATRSWTVGGLPAGTTRDSVSDAGVQGNDISSDPSISADGRYVAFVSFASNLVAGDTNNVRDVFVRDRLTGTIQRGAPPGVSPTNSSHEPAISADGRYVAFLSNATNLVAGDTNAVRDAFVWDRIGGSFTRVSVSSAGVQGNQTTSAVSISGDGRYVAFESNATNLVSGDTNAAVDVFVYDRVTATTTRVSVSSTGAQGDLKSTYPSLSFDGGLVVFASDATNLIAGDTNAKRDIFLKNLATGETTRVSRTSSGGQSNNGSDEPWISADGNVVAYHSNASNLVSGDTNAALDVFVFDRPTSTTTRVSVSSSGAQGNGASGGRLTEIRRRGSISSDGRYVLFGSEATNLVSGDTNATTDVFLRDRVLGTTTRVSVSSAGVQGNGMSRDGVLAAGGRHAAFASDATNLVTGDTNALKDVFVYASP